MNISDMNSENDERDFESNGMETPYHNSNRDVVIEQSTNHHDNRNNNADNNDNDTNETTEVTSIGLDELLYGASSFHAIVSPVLWTMILSAIAVTYVQTPESRSASEEQISGFYTVFDVSGDNSRGAATNFGLSLLNGLIIILVIAAATFLIVLLYKYKCMKLLMGYMVVASASLLGLLGGVMFITFMERYQIIMDQLTYYFLLVNFAAVGTISIFYSKGIPTFVTQGYLVLTSVILAWQLSHFNDWTAWTLLVLLALYDLCAVLTPCGPLRALVRLMQRDGSQPLPGLLYEAQLPQGVERPGRSRHGDGGNNNNSSSSSRNSSTHDNHSRSAARNTNRSSTNNSRNESQRSTPTAGTISNNHNSLTTSRNSSRELTNTLNTETNRNRLDRTVQPIYSSTSDDVVIGSVPFAICKVYKLTVSSENCPDFVREKYRPGITPHTIYTREELLTQVSVVFPRNGGIITLANSSGGRQRNNSIPRYQVFGRDGQLKRVLVVNEEGRVFEEVDGDSPDESEDKASNSIKLGLGDFIFYSVLVAKAAQNSFTTFASCVLVILSGLGGTLVLLSVYHNALPALPISIFLGVLFYFATKDLIEPWVETILTSPFYV
jgi:presenilin 1